MCMRGRTMIYWWSGDITKADRGARVAALLQHWSGCFIAWWREVCKRGRTMIYRRGYVAKQRDAHERQRYWWSIYIL